MVQVAKTTRGKVPYRYFAPVVSVAAMLIVAALTHTPSIIFPEAGAIATIAIVLRPRPVIDRAPLIAILATIDAVIGVLLAGFSGLSVLREAMSLFIVLCELYFLRSSLIPLISVTMLPVVFHITSPLYVVSVSAMSILLSGATLLDKTYNHKDESHSSLKTLSFSDGHNNARITLIFTVVALIWIGSTHLFLLPYFMAPPIFVSALDWLQEQHVERSFLIRRFCLLFGATSIGELGYLYIGHILGSILAITVVLLAAKVVSDLHPPLMAIAILPQVVRPSNPGLYIFGVLLGLIVLYAGSHALDVAASRYLKTRTSSNHSNHFDVEESN